MKMFMVTLGVTSEYFCKKLRVKHLLCMFFMFTMSSFGISSCLGNFDDFLMLLIGFHVFLFNFQHHPSAT